MLFTQRHLFHILEPTIQGLGLSGYLGVYSQFHLFAVNRGKYTKLQTRPKKLESKVILIRDF